MSRLGVSLLALALAASATSGEAREWLPGILHVHSDVSTGDFPLETLAEMAEREGIGALLLAENYLARVELGVPPFRALTRVAHEERSVIAGGVDRYLERVRAVRRRFPRLVVLPGVEVIPHYEWAGSPVALGVALRNTQKNVLVFGVEDGGALASLPSIGNPGARAFTTQSVLDALPVVLLVPAALLLRKRSRRIRIGRGWVVVKQRRWVPGIALGALAIIAVVRGWPFTADRHPAWASPGLEPHQELIDHVDRLGGMTFWSFPEARDEGERAVGPIRVSWRTDPYADDLLRTARYTGFGAVYEDTTRFERPGAGWDALLRQYTRGERTRPAWGVGESGFHGPRAGKTFGGVRTVFLVDERTDRGVLDALRRGRMYAVRRTATAGLALDTFGAASGKDVAVPGETLRVRSGERVDVRIAIAGSGPAALPIRVALIKNGAVAASWSGATPFTTLHTETFDGAPAYFRLDVWGPSVDHHLVTNPVFVGPA